MSYLTIIQALIIALVYGFSISRHAVGLIGLLYWRPIAIGFFIGILLGDVVTGTILGASLQVVFLGVTYFGGSISLDARVASYLVIPIAMVNNMSLEAAAALAVPIASLGVVAETITRTINTAVWVPYVDRAIEKVQTTKIRLGSGLFPVLTTTVIMAVPMFIMLYFGQHLVAAGLDAMPAWILAALNGMGGLLPALGFATYIRVIGTKKLLPFFILGFFIIRFFDLSIFAVAILAFATGYLTLFVNDELMEG